MELVLDEDGTEVDDDDYLAFTYFPFLTTIQTLTHSHTLSQYHTHRLGGGAGTR